MRNQQNRSLVDQEMCQGNFYMQIQQFQNILLLKRHWQHHCWANLKEENLAVNAAVQQAFQRTAQKKTLLSKISLKVKLRHNLHRTLHCFQFICENYLAINFVLLDCQIFFLWFPQYLDNCPSGGHLSVCVQSTFHLYGINETKYIFSHTGNCITISRSCSIWFRSFKKDFGCGRLAK